VQHRVACGVVQLKSSVRSRGKEAAIGETQGTRTIAAHVLEKLARAAVPGEYNVGLQGASQKETHRREKLRRLNLRFGPENAAFERGLKDGQPGHKIRVVCWVVGAQHRVA
jgi:hypothetical protein